MNPKCPQIIDLMDQASAAGERVTRAIARLNRALDKTKLNGRSNGYDPDADEASYIPEQVKFAHRP